MYDEDLGERRVLVFANAAMKSEESESLDPAPSCEIVNHSPTGFNWGYGGSGPSQLALALLLDATGDKERAGRFYQTFKWEQVAHMPAKWEMRQADILKWLTEKENEQ